MVSHLLLSLVSICTVGHQADQDIEALKGYAQKVLRVAYSATSQPPSDFWLSGDPEVDQSTEKTSFRYSGGFVTFRPGNPNPNYFQCNYSPTMRLEQGLNARQLRQRATEFVRTFSPKTPFLIETGGSIAQLRLHPMEHGTPHSMHYWLMIDSTTGVVTHGSFPGVPPQIKRIPSTRVGKDVAIAESIQRALLQNPELDLFRINKAVAYWVVPKIDAWSNAPLHVRAAASEKKAVKAYFIDFNGEKTSLGRKSMKVGSMYVDAETGRALSGSMGVIDGLGSGSESTVGTLSPTAVFLKNTWKPIVTKTLSQRSADPKGEQVLAIGKNVIIKGRYDGKAQVLWLPDKEAWRAVSVSK